jgi:hypothetical protein
VNGIKESTINKERTDFRTARSNTRMAKLNMPLKRIYRILLYPGMVLIMKQEGQKLKGPKGYENLQLESFSHGLERNIL